MFRWRQILFQGTTFYRTSTLWEGRFSTGGHTFLQAAGFHTRASVAAGRFLRHGRFCPRLIVARGSWSLVRPVFFFADFRFLVFCDSDGTKGAVCQRPRVPTARMACAVSRTIRSVAVAVLRLVKERRGFGGGGTPLRRFSCHFWSATFTVLKGMCGQWSND